MTNAYVFLMWSEQSANGPWKWIRVKIYNYPIHYNFPILGNGCRMVHFERDAIRKSIETVTTHFRQLIARKSKNESKTTWSIVCPITLTQRLSAKTASTNFRRLIARGAKINALRLCTMCSGKFAGRPINRKYIFIYILSTSRNIWRYSTIHNASIS